MKAKSSKGKKSSHVKTVLNGTCYMCEDSPVSVTKVDGYDLCLDCYFEMNNNTAMILLRKKLKLAAMNLKSTIQKKKTL